MVVVQDKLISEDILEEAFVCNLEACKGACCWEGDFGAPLEPAELPVLREIFEKIQPFLLPEAVALLQEKGLYTTYEDDSIGTPLMPNGACAYMTLDESGIAKCGIEQTYRTGTIDFQKPISCHLYPIRVKKIERAKFEALNYDRWEICSPACQLGKKLKVPVYQFLKEPLIRKYGIDFFEELDAAARFMKEGGLEEG
ncbi:MAG: DUF3109 family protein [Saprospirales bacterium]|nr:DUF3109 family protein [Saprospirales bacterium]MBK8489558.1 DUF3109 family protein [Saprospirales bacterium]